MQQIKWVQIEPTQACNLKCTYCSRTLLYGNSFTHMEKTLMEKIVSEMKNLPQLRQVLIQGFGEPFLYPDLLEMVTLLKSTMPHLSVQLVTNGMVMSKKLPQILAQTDVLYMSIDSLKPEYWATVRVGGNLNKIMDNVKRFKEANPALMMIVNAVISTQNMEEVDALCGLAQQLGCSGIQFIPLYSMEEMEVLTNEHWGHMREEVKRLRITYDSLQVFSPFDVKKQEICPWVHNGLYILIDGQVTPCCVMSSDDDIVYGDLSTQSLEQILSSSSRTVFTKNNKQNKSCTECTLIKFSRIWNYENPLPLIQR